MSQSEPEINYLAKDYASFRRLMLERLALLQPGGVEDQPADLQVALVELLAYTADRLSYYQDAVATEAYLGTARSRVSLRRHARLLGYRLHEGCNARVWLRCQVDEQKEVSPEWRFLTSGADPVVFEPCHYPRLYPEHNDPIELYAQESNSTLCAVLKLKPERSLKLSGGDLLLLESVGPEGETPLRHVVRLTAAKDQPDGSVQIAWGAEDALPFALPMLGDGEPTAQAYGNIVLADHGETLKPESVKGASRLRLPAGPVTYADPLPEDWLKPGQVITSAGRLLRRDVWNALPAIKELVNREGTWKPCLDLLACEKVEAAFVVETEHDGSALLRFGDGSSYGRRPSDLDFHVRYRVGNGRPGNVGAEAICRVVHDKDGKDLPEDVPGVTVSNPVPACGGEDPEPAEQVRLFAPQAFRKQLRAINAEDYAARAATFPGVQRAAADIRWTGSWYTVYLFIDPIEGTEIDGQRLSAHLDGYRLAGYDLEIRGATYVEFEITLTIECKPGSTPGAVMAALKNVLSAYGASGGRRAGYFHPENWTFGQPLYLSRFYRAVLAVPGVAAADVGPFERRDKPGSAARDLGMIEIGPHEILTSKIVQSQEGELRLTIKGSV